MSLTLVYADLMSAQDGCLLAITHGEPLPTAYLQQLPPWRAVMLARVADKAGIGLEKGTLAQLIQESARVHGGAFLGNWWEQ